MKLLSPKKVADELGVSHWTVGRLIRSGELPAVPLHIGKRVTYRVREETLQRWLANREGKSAKHVNGTRKRRTETKRPANFDGVLTGDADGPQVPEVSARAHAGLSSDEPSGDVI